VVSVSDSRSRGPGFDSWPVHRQAATLGKLLTPMSLCHQATAWWQSLVPAKRRWCSVTGKLTVGLSHWPYGTDFSGLSTYGLTAKGREMSTPPMPPRGMVHFTLFTSPSAWRSVDVYGQLKQPTMFSHGCVPSLLSEVSLTPVRPHGTACPSQSTEHHPRQPSNDNSKHFYSVTLLTLLYERLWTSFKSANFLPTNYVMHAWSYIM